MQEEDPSKVYAIHPDAMSRGIEWFLDPVIKRLVEIARGFTSAHAEVDAAHESEATGWFGGEGNGEVKWKSSSFLNACEWQLRQLSVEQAELVRSLEEYRAMLQGHIAWARETDEKNADNFRAIGRQLDWQGR